MSTFQARVEDYIGTASDTDALTGYLTDGARILVDYLVSKGSDKLDLYATDKSDAGSGVDITGGTVISAHKTYYPAKRIPVEMKAKAADGDSLEYAISTDPSWYMEKTKGYVLPSGGTIRWVGYPTVTYSDSTITSFPPQGYAPIVCYAAIQYQIGNINALIKTTLGGVAFSLPSVVSSPSVPSFTWTDATAATVGLNLVSFSDTLSFTPPVFSGSYTNMDTALGNQDVELAQGYANKIQSQLNQYSQDLQNAAAQFQEDLQTYQLGLQQAIENARIESQRLSQQAQLTTDVNLQNEIQTLNQQIQEYQATLSRYQGDIASYSAQIQKEVSRVQTLIQQYQVMSANYISVMNELRTELKTLMESL